ncbi:unnamed protein product [Protopolystoma xenopodis]|uniref:Uncharacterized protein n=1 Tax=Protopolystoma xenopodis TaxID=117903 RepID=A0A448XQ34_9PLAT|nr:unnamed protein product [Protopolystoma xenopodis]
MGISLEAGRHYSPSLTHPPTPPLSLRILRPHTPSVARSPSFTVAMLPGTGADKSHMQSGPAGEGGVAVVLLRPDWK